MTTIYKYRVYCETDSKWEYEWKTTPPTTCPTNTSHTVNASSISVIDEMTQNEVVVKETQIPPGSTPIGGYYRLTCQAFDAAPNTTTTSSFSYPFPIAIISGYMKTSDDMKGDVVSVGVGYNTPLGVLTADAKTNDTVISITPAAVANYYMRVGGYVRLTDGVNTTGYSQVVSKSTINNTITLRTPLAYNFNAASPTYIQIAVIFADNVEFGLADKYDMGTSNIGASYVPANLPFKITYVNNTNLTKRMVLIYDYYY